MTRKQILLVLVAAMLVSCGVTIAVLGLSYWVVRSYAPAVLPLLPATPPTSSGVTRVITSTLSYSDALATYKEIAAKAIGTSERSVQMVTWALGFVILISGGVVGYLFKTCQEAAQTSRSAKRTAEDAKSDVGEVKDQIKGLSNQYRELLKEYINVGRAYAELGQGPVSLNIALRARDEDEISDAELIEVQQVHSWLKWVQRKDETGFHELLEDVRSGDGLTPSARALVEGELAKVSQRASKEGVLSSDDSLYERRLLLLLSETVE